MNRTKKYQINESFFDNIDSEAKAYFLGYLFADGYNNELRGNVRLSLKETDISVLESLSLLLYPDNDRPLGTNKKKDCIDLKYLDITNKHISRTLAKLGMIQAKTFRLELPDINSNMYSHFIRGYMDGDGCINHFMLGDRYFKCQIRFIGTKSFCESIQSIINNNCNTTGSIRKRGNIYELAYMGRNQTIKVCEYLYKDSEYFLERKFNKFKEIKEHKDGRYKNS